MDQTYQSTNYGANAAENYERFFVPDLGRPFAEDLLSQARIEDGDRVLDVACGTGIVSRLVAERTGAGSVVGLDLNPGMLHVARIAASDYPAIEWREGDVQSMPFEVGAFDVIFCQMGLQFVPDQGVALREMHRVLSPGGRAYLNVPGPKPRLFQIMDEGVGRRLGDDAAAFVELVFSLHEADDISNMFRKAGFSEVRIDASPKALTVAPPREFLWQYLHSTPLAQQAMEADDEVREALERDVCPRWDEFVVNGNMAFEVVITTASAVR